MKTKLTLFMLLALSLGGSIPSRGQEVLADIDGDGFAEVVDSEDLDADTIRRLNLCGGADDDQDTRDYGQPDGNSIVQPPAPAGLILFTSSQGPYQLAPQPAGPARQPLPAPSLYTSSQGPYQMAGSPVNEHLGAPLGFYTDSAGAFPLTGGSVNVAKPLTGDAGDDLIDRQILQLMTNGQLHGDDGSDTLSPSAPVNGFVWGTTSYVAPAAPTNGFVFGTTTYLNGQPPFNGFVFGTTSY